MNTKQKEMPPLLNSIIIQYLSPFLNRHCKFIMVPIYKRFYKKEIMKCLGLLYEYKYTPIEMYDIAKIMTLDEDTWSIGKCYQIIGICHYLGYIQGHKK